MISSWPPPGVKVVHSALSLKPFSDSDSNGKVKLTFSVARTSTEIQFVFSLVGSRPADLLDLVIPELRSEEQRVRQDDLWKNTCLEIFLAPANQTSYFELNLSPSGNWNFYAFDSYRSGMRQVDRVQAPLHSIERSPTGDVVSWRGSFCGTGKNADCEISKLLAADGLVLSATAVLEYESGQREYWALSHLGEKPDFHLRESFKIVL
jgi:hypothetical protein